ncbi:glycosyltransferase family 39 protein [Halorientalis brevis]|uniref:Glycosyltransferase family 39 protein n=1 Tax=Halorientalis brevis TaxID=1126241 RepID=A0ABD6C919_9EURY|nr:glycosyltransferase family 39 protein [Halorientalis brevis]
MGSTTHQETDATENVDGRERLTDYPAWLYVVVVLGAALRLAGLGAEDYWLDEITSLQYVLSRSLGEVIVELPLVDRHPPLYYALLDGWVGLLGTGEASVRLLSAGFGIASLPLLYALGKRLYDEQVGVLAAGLLAVSGMHLQQSQNARMYSLLVLAALASMYWLVRLREAPDRRAATGYLLSTVVLGYTHVFGLFVVAAQNGYLLTSRLGPDRDWPVPLRRWLGLQVGVGIAVLPYLAVLSRQVLALGDGGGVALGWIPDPTVSRLVFAIGQYLHPRNPMLGLAAVVLVGVFAAAGRTRAPLHRENTALLAWWLLVPLLVPFALSYLVAPLFVARYTIAALPALLLLVAAEIRRLGAVEFRYIGVALLVGAAVAGLPGYYGQPQNGEWEAATGLVAGNASQDDLVVVSDRAANDTFAFYYDGAAPVRGVQEDANDSTINETIRGHDTVWLVFSRMDPTQESQFTRLLDREGYDVRTTREFNAVDVRQYVRNGTAD